MSGSGATTGIIEPIKEWLATCDRCHASTCVKPTASSTQLSSRPYRLIDVENQCIVRGNVQGQYLALSYIWQDDTRGTGKQQHFQLSLSNAESLAAPFSLRQDDTQLPKTIRDAMELTVALQKKYLWVDRLCIVQDHPQKEEEFMRMDQIYSGAYMTIIAAAEHGLYGTPAGTIHDPALQSPDNWFSRRITNRDRSIKDYYVTVSRSKWAKRAWTYQEYLLSKRVLFFLNTRIFWQCERAIWDKDHFRPEQDDETENMVSSNSGPTRSFSVPSWPDFGLYADLICPYNGRDLSYSKDGLSACSGILRRLAPAFPDGFLFGLPRIYLDYALLWQPLKAHHKRPESTVITDGCLESISFSTRRSTLPSWAWCGWQCFVNPQSFQAALNLDQDGRYRGDSTSSWKVHNIITWQDASTSIRGPIGIGKSLQKPKDQTLQISSIQSPSTTQSTSSTTSNHITAPASHAFFFPAATLEICMQAGVRREHSASILSAFVNPILSEKNLFEKPKVVVLRDPERKFCGLLCITGNSGCQQGEPMELIAISRGSANGRNLKDCFEERVFSMSRYQSAKPFWPVHDYGERWVDVSYFVPRPGERHYRVVATGEYETDLKVEEEEYKDNQEYEFYNVLWVQGGGDGIMYRAGCGRILTKYWEGNNPTNTWITLG